MFKNRVLACKYWPLLLVLGCMSEDPRAGFLTEAVEADHKSSVVSGPLEAPELVTVPLSGQVTDSAFVGGVAKAVFLDSGLEILSEPIDEDGSFELLLQGQGPFWMVFSKDEEDAEEVLLYFEEAPDSKTLIYSPTLELESTSQGLLASTHADLGEIDLTSGMPLSKNSPVPRGDLIGSEDAAFDRFGFRTTFIGIVSEGNSVSMEIGFNSDVHKAPSEVFGPNGKVLSASIQTRGSRVFMKNITTTGGVRGVNVDLSSARGRGNVAARHPLPTFSSNERRSPAPTRRSSGGSSSSSSSAAETLVLTIESFAGTGGAGNTGDGGQAADAELVTPRGVEVDADGNVYFADEATHTIRKIDTSGVITTVAGDGSSGFLGDGGLATAAKLNTPYDVTVDSVGNLYIADKGNHRIRRVDASTGFITTAAGTGASGFNDDAAASAEFSNPVGIAIYNDNLIYIGDTSNQLVRLLNLTTGNVTSVAGTQGQFGSTGDGGAATSAKLDSPYGIAVDSLGNVYIADVSNSRIRKITVGTGLISTVAGSSQGDSGDGAAATSAQLDFPYDVHVTSDGDIYIADTQNHKIRKVDILTGFISTIAGTGAPAFNGDGVDATLATLNGPQGVSVDSVGNVYIGDSGNRKIRRFGDEP